MRDARPCARDTASANDQVIDSNGGVRPTGTHKETTMKLVRILAIIPLVLISLMNIGYAVATTDPRPNIVLAVLVGVMGLAGLVAAYGLARNLDWGIPAALTWSGVNVAAAVIALVADEEGAIVGLVVSAVALALAFTASMVQRKVSVA